MKKFVHAALLLPFLTTAAVACVLLPIPTVLDEYDEADVVMIARVVSLKKSTEFDPRHWGDVRSATFIVEKVFKGDVKVQDQLVFGQGNGIRCIWTFDDQMIGRKYLLYVEKPSQPSDLWWVWAGRSNDVVSAVDDLLYLEKMNQVRGRTRVSGILDDENGFQPALRNIQISGNNKTYKTRTDVRGVYELYDLPPGRYLIKPELPYGWKIDREWSIPSVSEKRINSWQYKSFTLKPKKHAVINFAFKLANSVSGRILGPSGKPVNLICVSLIPTDREHYGGCSALTDEKGRFKIDGVEAGSYFLMLHSDDRQNPKKLPRLYYPYVRTTENATRFLIQQGESLRNLNFRLSASDLKGQ